GAFVFDFPENRSWKSLPCQFCSPTISVASWMFCPLAASAEDTRQRAAPPEPASSGATSTKRSSNAPLANAPFPANEQPVTAKAFGLMPVAEGPNCTSASMMRLAPQAQQMSEPDFAAVLP